ncbi:MAG: glycogen/starch/alpha-glucan phosphorylase [Deltaproteobacteria bacterium]|nr:glycogen/starch/alpha-glucan phosphorylase [Deltaproteobacteria bacterium]
MGHPDTGRGDVRAGGDDSGGDAPAEGVPAGGIAGRDARTGAFLAAVHRNVRYLIGKRWEEAAPRDLVAALALAAREPLIERMFESERRYAGAGAKRLYYLSVEFLMGRALGNTLLNLGLLDTVERSLEALGVDWEEVVEAEPDAALGNGGLGRLAACYLDSLATLDLPGFGYGINYDYGLFRQAIEGNQQREYPEPWRRVGAAWQIERPERACWVPVYGRARRRSHGAADWHDWRVIVGVPYDMPVAGWGARTVNRLRLFSARSPDEFDIEIFHRGDYLRAFERKLSIERISALLYPSDSTEQGKELRLLQEYFFVACSLRDVLSQYLETRSSLDALPAKVAIQLNDTHPALAIAEWIRLLVDEHGMGFDRAVELTRGSFAYTNHTLLPEALEHWPRPLLARVVPRHLQIIEDLNAHHLAAVELRWPGDVERMRRLSIFDEAAPKHVRMAHLAVVGSHTVNGVSALHSELVRTRLLPDFAELWPEKFRNVTNGVTPRRWLAKANPGLARAIDARLGCDWITDLDRLAGLEPLAGDPGFRAEFRAVKRANKERLAREVSLGGGAALDPDAIFDVQVKRIHEYKRQLLAALHGIHLYLQIAEDGLVPAAPRACLFAGKAPPEYWMAKLVIHLLCNLAEVVNHDPRTAGLLRVAFVPDYRVSLAEKIIPAADLSEQISTAGFEASGTGNMKLALNGALTIGTLDGANVEIREAVGADNFYLFGLRAEQVEELRMHGGYDPRERYESSAAIRRVLDAIGADRFSRGEPGVFRPILENLLDHGDPYFVLADFESYREAQERVAHDFRDADAWSRRAILNVARVGRFSSDRAVREYAARIWSLEAVP